MRTLILMRGLPGSGKSTLAKQLATTCRPFSTDNYWIRPDGYYDFNIERLPEAHDWTRRAVLAAMHAGVSPIVVDNTNIKLQDMQPYRDLAKLHGYNVEFVEPTTEWRYDVDECHKRNTHRVPHAAIKAMADKFEPLLCG